MSLSASDVVVVLPATPGTTPTTSNVGGALSGSELNQEALNGLWYTMTSNAFGGADVLQVQKVGIKNTSVTDSANAVKVYLANAIDDLTGSAVISLVSSSSSDNSSFMVRLHGRDASDNPQTLEVTLNGTTTVTTTGVTWNALYRAEFREVGSTEPFANATGKITITHGPTVVGEIPEGYSCASGEFSLGMEATINGTQTTTNPETLPSGVSFFKVRTLATALSIQNGGVLGVSGGGFNAQGLWIKCVIADGTGSTPDVNGYYPLLAISFSA